MDFCKRQRSQFVKENTALILQHLKTNTMSSSTPFDQSWSCEYGLGPSKSYESEESSKLTEMLESLKSSSDEDFLLFCYSLICSGHYSLFVMFLKENLVDCKSLEQVARLQGHNKKLSLLIDLHQNYCNGISSRNEPVSQLQYDFLFRHKETLKIILKLDGLLNYLLAVSAISQENFRFITSQTDNFVERLICVLVESPIDSLNHFVHGLLLTNQLYLFSVFHEIVNIYRLEEFFSLNANRLFQNDENFNSLAMNQNISNSSQWSCNAKLINALNNSTLTKNNSNQEYGCDYDDDDDDEVPETDGLLTNLSVDMPDSKCASHLAYYRENKDEIYKNFTKPKGLALVINNSNFYHLRNRDGTEVDRKNITNLLNQLGYNVLPVLVDLTAAEMHRRMREFAAHPDHKHMHSCVVVVLTHGEYDCITGVDSGQINLHDFLACLNAKNAPNLAGKPKIVFLQACRGVNYDNGVERCVSVDGTDGTCKLKIKWRNKKCKNETFYGLNSISNTSNNVNWPDYDNNNNNIATSHSLPTTKSLQSLFSCIGLRFNNNNNGVNTQSEAIGARTTRKTAIRDQFKEQQQLQQLAEHSVQQQQQQQHQQQRLPRASLPYNGGGLSSLQQFLPRYSEALQQTPRNEPTNEYRVVREPSDADMLIAYATTPNYVSWRNNLNGTWFIQSICQIFSKYACNEDIITMLTRVNKQVAYVYQSSSNGAKQIPEVASRLRRKFYFFPGITSEE